MTHRRSNGEGSVYYHSALRRWCAIVPLPDGKRKSVYAATKRDAQRLLGEAAKRRDQGLPPSPQRLSVESFLTSWLRDSARPNVRPWTYTGYESVVRTHLLPELGRTTLQDLSPQQVQALINRKHSQGLSAKSVQNIRGVLRTALNDAMRWELVNRNVAALIRVPRGERKPIKPLTPEEARHLLEAARGDRLGPLYSVALAMGLRQGEALGLTWDHVDLKGGVIRVERQLQRVDGRLKLVPLKTARSRRSLPVPESLITLLREHIEVQQRERRAAGSLWVKTDLVFTSTVGTGLDGPNVTKEFQKLLRRAGIRRRRFHDLRHSCASLLLAQNVSPRVVMELLGHSQISMTMNTYSHVLPDLKNDAVALMEQCLWPDRPEHDSVHRRHVG